MNESATIPAFDTPQQLRAAVDMEMQMAGLTEAQRQGVMAQVDAYVVEAIVASGAELTTSTREDMRWSLWDIENRVIGRAPVSGEEMLARVAASAATRTNVVSGYNKLRERLAKPTNTPAPSPAPPPTIHRTATAYPVMIPPVRTVVLSGRARLLIVLAALAAMLLVAIWFLNATGLTARMQRDGAVMQPQQPPAASAAPRGRR